MSGSNSMISSGDLRGRSAVSSAYLSFCQALLRWTGFTKAASLLLFILTVGMFAMFSALQTRSLEEGHALKPNPPGEHFWFRSGLMHLAMQVHLCSVIPAGMLLPLQFLPVMRQRYMHLHKITGRILLTLLIIGTIAALIMAKHSFGGTITTQTWVVTVTMLTLFSVYKAWTSILHLRIDQHRIWILRTWTYACTILTLRFFMGIIAILANKISQNAFKSVTTCQEIVHMYRWVTDPDSVASLYKRYPACANTNPIGSTVYVIVNARLSEKFPEERAALLNMVFGVSGWAALVVHILLLEAYLNYSRNEDDRLKKASMKRRGATGFEATRGSTR